MEKYNPAIPYVSVRKQGNETVPPLPMMFFFLLFAQFSTRYHTVSTLPRSSDRLIFHH
jgi:hypothetical protein